MTRQITDIEDDLRAAIALTRLAEWISSAQDTLERVRHASDLDPQLSALLKKHRVAVFSSEDSPCAGAGLQWLQLTIAERLRAVERIAGLSADIPEADHG